jgi:hypothetical protein
VINAEVDRTMTDAINSAVDTLNSDGNFKNEFARLMNVLSLTLLSAAADRNSNNEVLWTVQLALIGSLCVGAEAKRRGLEIPEIVPHATNGKDIRDALGL